MAVESTRVRLADQLDYEKHPKDAMHYFFVYFLIKVVLYDGNRCRLASLHHRSCHRQLTCHQIDHRLQSICFLDEHFRFRCFVLNAEGVSFRLNSDCLNQWWVEGFRRIRCLLLGHRLDCHCLCLLCFGYWRWYRGMTATRVGQQAVIRISYRWIIVLGLKNYQRQCYQRRLVRQVRHTFWWNARLATSYRLLVDYDAALKHLIS